MDPVRVGDMAAAWVRDMVALVVSAMAVRHRPLLQGTRCSLRFQARSRMARITAHQASAWDTRYKRRFRRCSQARTRIAGIMVHQVMPDIPAHPVSARGTRCKRQLQARPPGIPAHRASAPDTRCKRQLQARPPGIPAHRASAQDTKCKRRLRILRPATTSNWHRASRSEAGRRTASIRSSRHATVGQPRRGQAPSAQHLEAPGVMSTRRRERCAAVTVAHGKSQLRRHDRLCSAQR